MGDLTAEQRARFEALLLGLAEIFDAEGRPGGDEAAEALRGAVGQTYQPLDFETDLGNHLQAALSRPDAMPIAEQVRAAGDLLPWHYSGLADGRIPAHMAKFMQTCCVIGEHSPLPYGTVRVGLFMQGPGIDYTTRIHAAEETFFIVSGRAKWQADGAPPAAHGPGTYVHHPSNVPHASVTEDEPVLAAWRWTGNTSRAHYKLLD